MSTMTVTQPGVARIAIYEERDGNLIWTMINLYDEQGNTIGLIQAVAAGTEHPPISFMGMRKFTDPLIEDVVEDKLL